jgi:hypothetical protein
MDIAKAEEKKKLGNDEHKKGNHPAAVRLYTEAIGKTPTLNIHPRLEPERAHVLLKSGVILHPHERVLKSHRGFRGGSKVKSSVRKGLCQIIQVLPILGAAADC